MEFKNLIYEKEDHIVTITINRPEVHNCISAETSDELQVAWKAFRDDDDALVAVYTGAGDEAFSAGWDLKDAAALHTIGDYEEYRQSIYNCEGYCGYTKRMDIFKPIIAAVNGYCFAAGLENALLADIRIAAERAEFGCLERRWNIVAGDGLSVRLPLVVGYAKALELLITGRRIDVQEAYRIGLVNEIVPNGQALTRAKELAGEIAELPQGALRSDKESLIRGFGRPIEERLRIEQEMLLSMFMRKDKHAYGAASFIGKKKPEWKHHGL